jgi:EpsI family protein
MNGERAMNGERVVDAPLLIVIGLAIVVGFVIWLPRRVDAPPARPVAVRAPAQVAGWQVADGAPDEVLPRDDRAVDAVRRTYSDGRSLIWVSVARYDSRRDGDWRPSVDRIVAARGAKSVAADSLELRDLPAGSMSVQRIRLTRSDRQLSMLVWYEVDHRVIANEYALRWWLFVETLRGHRPSVVLVRLATLGVAMPDAFLRSAPALLDSAK